jgi:hypothetical protein
VHADSGRVDPDDSAVASPDEIPKLTARIRELEVQYAAEIERRHRAEQALANTQFELVEARRRASETERLAADPDREIVSTTFLAEVRTDSSGTPEPTTPAPEVPVDLSPEIVSKLVSRFSRLRQELGTDDPAAPLSSGSGPRSEVDPDLTNAPGGVDDSLRSRLSSAANARRRVGLAQHPDPSSMPSA